VSRATDDDVPALVRMYMHHDLKQTEDEAAWFVGCYLSSHRILVAKVDGVPKGACFWRIEGERHCGLGWVDNLWVEEDSRHIGLGERLLRAAIEDMRGFYSANGFRLRRVVLTTQVDRPDARRLYERVGFRLLARLDDLYDDGIEDLFYVLAP
jgi:ribosomal protein S18 acetylase RimI-like enzyme